MSDDLVWYAAYGSNLLAERFACYVLGGVPPLGRVHQPGCPKDDAPPRAERACLIPHRPAFVSRSSQWDGAVAVIDPERDPEAMTFGRRWLISWTQFQAVCAQEAGLERVELERDQVTSAGHRLAGAKLYDFILPLGIADDGIPIHTLTSSRRPAELSPGQPSIRYLALICAGLRETANLNRSGAKKYLSTWLGVAGGINAEALTKAWDLLA